jgi:hypothetical protein
MDLGAALKLLMSKVMPKYRSDEIEVNICAEKSLQEFGPTQRTRFFRLQCRCIVLRGLFEHQYIRKLTYFTLMFWDADVWVLVSCCTAPPLCHIGGAYICTVLRSVLPACTCFLSHLNS